MNIGRNIGVKRNEIVPLRESLGYVKFSYLEIADNLISFRLQHRLWYMINMGTIKRVTSVLVDNYCRL